MKIFITTKKNVAANVVIQMGEKKKKTSLEKTEKWSYQPMTHQALVVQKVDNAIHGSKSLSSE